MIIRQYLRPSSAVMLVTSTAILASTLSHAAEAQAPRQAQSATASAPAAEVKEEEGLAEVVVTGSRVARVGFESPTPVTSVDVENLRAANPGSFNDALRQMPVLSNSAGPRGASGNSGSSGSFLNLRRLGGPRTLVLLDGRRFVPTTQTGTVDTALFPEALVKRVDIVTGGASAAYGSDAVAGVVNFILDKEFKGFKAEGLYGTLEGGLNPEYGVKTAGGFNVGDRGHVIMAGEYYKNDGIISVPDITSTGDWQRQQCAVIANPGGATGRTFACNVRVSNESHGGLVIAGPLRGLQFNSSGDLVPFDIGTLNSATTQVGGDGPYGAYRSVIVGSSRTSLFTRGSWDLTDSIQPYVEVNYARTTSDFFIGTFSQFQTGTALTIQRDNPYLSAASVARMVTAGVTNVRIGRYNDDFTRPHVADENRTLRLVGGIEGHTDRLHWSAYYQHGQNKVDHVVTRIVNNDNFVRAVDAVRATNGSIVCRSTLTTPTNGCVPVNVLGVQDWTDQELDYVTGTSWFNGTLKQDVVAAELSADLFELPAGQVSLAGGVEYRKESIAVTSDPLSKAVSAFTGVVGSFQTANFADQAGGISVKEGFLETVVPVFKDLPGAKSLEFNGAVRRTDYSTSGGVTTWKTGLTWTPFEFIRFRGTRSRDIRAPNLSELFNQGSSGRGNVTDQTFNPPRVAPGVLNVNRGNPNLVPEVAKTLTFGAVLSPTFIPNFDISVDAYNIEINGAIASPSATQITLDCRNGSAEACSRLVRDSTGTLSTIYIIPINLSRLKATGIDWEVAYRFRASDVIASVPGDFSLRFLGTKVNQSYTVAPGAAIVDRTGDSSQPSWRWTLNAGWRNAGLNISTLLRYTGSGPYDSTTLATDLPQRKMPGQVLVNLNVDYTTERFGGKYGVFFNVQNIANKQSPPFGDLSIYDTLGRAFRAGVRVSY